jgi:NAD-dependent SIR2 family protein deacetylase
MQIKHGQKILFKNGTERGLFIVLGSSLVVTPAADMPAKALNVGAKLVIINQGDTPFDRYAHLRFHEQIGTIFTKAVKKLKGLMGLVE